MQAMTATLVRHLKEQRRNFSIIITRISSHVCCPLEERVFRRAKTSIYIMQWSVSFYLISIKRNRKLDDKLQVQTKPKGQNT